MSKTTVCKTYRFDAAHHLPGHPSPCKNVHGHTYTVEIYATGSVKHDGPERGMVVEYARITGAWEALKVDLHHSDLNDYDDYPTTENIALGILLYMKHRVPEVFKVRLWEGPDQFAEVEL